MRIAESALRNLNFSFCHCPAGSNGWTEGSNSPVADSLYGLHIPQSAFRISPITSEILRTLFLESVHSMRQRYRGQGPAEYPGDRLLHHPTSAHSHSKDALVFRIGHESAP